MQPQQAAAAAGSSQAAARGVHQAQLSKAALRKAGDAIEVRPELCKIRRSSAARFSFFSIEWLLASEACSQCQAFIVFSCLLQKRTLQ
jgi:hypothetical protein